MVRSSKIQEFESTDDYSVLKSPCDIPDGVAERFADLIAGLMVLDFCPCEGSDQSLSVYILYDNGSIYNVSCNFEHGSDSIDGHFQFSDSKPHKIFRLANIDPNKDYLLIADTDAKIQVWDRNPRAQ